MYVFSRITHCYKSLTFLIFCALISTPIHAGLIVSVTDSGGLAQFELSGSDTVVTNGDFNNGLWFNDLFEIGAVDFSGLGSAAHALIGSGTITIDGMTQSIADVYANEFANFELAFRTVSSSNSTSVGDVISIAGLFTTDILFSSFNVGNYTFPDIGPFDGNQLTLTSDVTFNVGNTPVPEPTSIALLASGLLGFCVSRRTKKQA